MPAVLDFLGSNAGLIISGVVVGFLACIVLLRFADINVQLSAKEKKVSISLKRQTPNTQV